MLAPPATPRLILDITPSLHRLGGIGRYAGDLAAALAAGPPIGLHLFVVDVAGRPIPPPLDRTPARCRRQHPRNWRFEVAASTFLGRPMDAAVGAGPGDVFHATDHILPPLSSRVRTVFTLHDLGVVHVPGTHATLHRLYQRRMLPRFLARADLVVAVSESTRRLAIATYGLPEERVRTVHHGVADRFVPASPAAIDEVRARLRLPERYVLCVGTLEPRKNLATAFEAFAAAKMPGVALVHAGPAGWKVDAALGAGTAAEVAAREVRFVGPVGDADLVALYSGAAAFLFPSLYEGFGFPVLEAMACGTPVLSSDTTSMPEIVGEAGLLLPPRDVPAWVAALRSVVPVEQRDRARELVTRGRARAARFTWEATATAMRSLYEELHARRP